MDQSDPSMGEQGAAKPLPLDYAAPEPKKWLDWRHILASVSVMAGAMPLALYVGEWAARGHYGMERYWPLLLIGAVGTCAAIIVVAWAWRRESRSRVELAAECMVSLGIAILAASLIWDARSASPVQGRLVSCQSNLRQIYLAMAMYAQANGGRYPDDPADVLPIMDGTRVFVDRKRGQKLLTGGGGGTGKGVKSY